MDESDNQDLAWLIVAVVGVAAGMKVWASKIKPWLADLVPSLREEGGIEVGRWDLATSDVIAGVVLAVVLLVALGALRSSMRAKKRAKKRQARADAEV